MSSPKLLNNTHTRRIVAGQLRIRAEQLRPAAEHDGYGETPRPTAQQLADNDTADLLDEVAAELTAR